MPYSQLRPFLLAPLLVLLLFLPFSAGASPSQEPDQDDRPARTMTFTPESAAVMAERLIQEQQSPEFQTAMSHISFARYEQAMEILRPMTEAGNSMAMFWMGRSLWRTHGGIGLNSRLRAIPNEKAQEFFWKSADEGNFYAMFILGNSLNEMEVVKNCEQYCLLRAKANDPEAFFGLYRVGITLQDKADADLIVRGALLGSEVAVLFMTGGDAEMIASHVSEALNQEVPDWRERILVPLKAMADAGNPKAQYNYSLQTEKEPPYTPVKPSIYNATYPYMEKAFESRFADAPIALQVGYQRNTPTAENVKKTIFYTAVRSFEMNAPHYMPTLSRMNWGFYRHDKTKKVPVTQEELEAEVERAKKWHAEHPDVYNYRHPLWDSRQ